MIQGPIHKIFMTKYWELMILKWKTIFFLSRPFWFFYFSKKIFCFIPLKTSQSLLVSRDGSKILTIILVSSQTSPIPNIYVPSVCSILLQAGFLDRDRKEHLVWCIFEPDLDLIFFLLSDILDPRQWKMHLRRKRDFFPLKSFFV